jgi:hypothetical protein
MMKATKRKTPSFHTHATQFIFLLPHIIQLSSSSSGIHSSSKAAVLFPVGACMSLCLFIFPHPSIPLSESS